MRAIDNYLAPGPKSLTPEMMLSVGLYSGILDMTNGSEKYHPFRDLTFVVICIAASAVLSPMELFLCTLRKSPGVSPQAIKGVGLSASERSPRSHHTPGGRIIERLRGVSGMQGPYFPTSACQLTS